MFEIKEQMVLRQEILYPLGFSSDKTGNAMTMEMALFIREDHALGFTFVR